MKYDLLEFHAFWKLLYVCLAASTYHHPLHTGSFILRGSVSLLQ